MPDLRARELVELLVAHTRSADDAPLRRRLFEEFSPPRLTLRVLSPDDPAEVLEQVVAGEQVHPVDGPDDLQRRLAADRRILALVHPELPDRLLAFVEVALVGSLEVDMPTILDGPVSDPEAATVAIFYSINRCEEALGGLGVPGHLLERSLGHLHHESPTLALFSTLSPVPALRKHVEATDPTLAEALEGGGGDRSQLVAAATDLVTRVQDGRVGDPVAHFHLGNGARVERIADRADPSDRGQRRSWGVMANYRYEPERLETRAAAYRGGEVAVAPGLT